MKKTNKNSRKKLLNFLNESQVRVGKNIESLVDRLVINNSRERAGDIGEKIAELFFKNSGLIQRNLFNTNRVFRDNFPFADIVGVDSNGDLHLISVKASSTLGDNALSNSKVYFKKIDAMLKDPKFQESLEKLSLKPFDSLNPKIKVYFGIFAIDIALPKTILTRYSNEIEWAADRDNITELGSIEEIVKIHPNMFKLIEDKLYFKNENYSTEPLIKVKDFLKWPRATKADTTMPDGRKVYGFLYNRWLTKVHEKLINKKLSPDAKVYTRMRFFQIPTIVEFIPSPGTKRKYNFEILDPRLANAIKGDGYFKEENSGGFRKITAGPFSGGAANVPSNIDITDDSLTTLPSWALTQQEAGVLKMLAGAGVSRTIMSTPLDNRDKKVSKRQQRIDLYGELNNLLHYYLNNEDFEEVIAKAKEIVKSNHGITVESVIAKSLSKLLIEKKKLRKKRRRSKCTPARRRINSGGKAGSYADPRTGGKQAYAALKKAKPPGSRGGWTKKKCICCHKCPNDRSAPNGFVCTNPSHLYWGTKADNTYDQNRGNGWAARNKKKNEGDPNGEGAFAYELMISEDKVRSLIEKILKEDLESESWFGESFVNFKTAVSRGKDPLAYAKDNLREIGRGSTRVVFDFPDNPGVVLKIINTEVEKAAYPIVDLDGNILPEIGPEGDRRTKHGFFKSHMRQSNEWEADLIMQQKFPDIFPRTFEKADDFSWILAEKARPVASMEELIRILGVTDNFARPKSIKKIQFIKMIQDGINYFKDPDHPLRKINESPETTIDIGLLDDDPRDTMPLVGDTIRDSQLSGDTVANQVQKPYVRTETREDKRLRELISSSHNRAILGAMADLDIPPREFLPKNMGVSEISGKLLIIDASLWEEKKQVR